MALCSLSTGTTSTPLTPPPTRTTSPPPPARLPHATRACSDDAPPRLLRPTQPVDPCCAIFPILLFHTKRGWRQAQPRGLGQQSLKTISMPNQPCHFPKLVSTLTRQGS